MGNKSSSPSPFIDDKSVYAPNPQDEFISPPFIAIDSNSFPRQTVEPGSLSLTDQNKIGNRIQEFFGGMEDPVPIVTLPFRPTIPTTNIPRQPIVPITGPIRPHGPLTPRYDTIIF